MKRAWRWLLPLLVVVLGLSCWRCGGGGSEDELPRVVMPSQPRVLHGNTDLTFFVAADTHLGAEGMEAANLRQIEAMNSIAGHSWPPAIGGKIAEPKAVFIAGDLTNTGKADEWQDFVKLYGRFGNDGKLKYPVLLGTGNHDRFAPLHAVLEGVKARQGTLVYSWDWGDVHLINLDEYPTPATCRWLARDLAAAGQQTPVIIFLHYSLAGPFSDYWSAEDKNALAETLRGYNVIGIFHGHYHASLHYRWRGYDAYCIGSPRHGQDTFVIVNVTDNRLAVASWNWNVKGWQWWHLKAINAPFAPEPERTSGLVPDL